MARLTGGNVFLGSVSKNIRYIAGGKFDSYYKRDFLAPSVPDKTEVNVIKKETLQQKGKKNKTITTNSFLKNSDTNNVQESLDDNKIEVYLIKNEGNYYFDETPKRSKNIRNKNKSTLTRNVNHKNFNYQKYEKIFPPRINEITRREIKVSSPQKYDKISSTTNNNKFLNSQKNKRICSSSNSLLKVLIENDKCFLILNCNNPGKFKILYSSLKEINDAIHYNQSIKINNNSTINQLYVWVINEETHFSATYLVRIIGNNKIFVDYISDIEKY